MRCLYRGPSRVRRHPSHFGPSPLEAPLHDSRLLNVFPSWPFCRSCRTPTAVTSRDSWPAAIQITSSSNWPLRQCLKSSSAQRLGSTSLTAGGPPWQPRPASPSSSASPQLNSSVYFALCCTASSSTSLFQASRSLLIWFLMSFLKAMDYNLHSRTYCTVICVHTHTRYILLYTFD